MLSTKKKYDPENIFWGNTAVGIEAPDVDIDGRLYPVSK
jgi:hypothetical protein